MATKEEQNRRITVLVTGDRNWTDIIGIGEVFVDFLEERNIDPADVTVIHGDARGADKLAAYMAEFLGMNPIPYPAKWTQYGKAAGPIRNKEMLTANPDIEFAFAFHPNLKESKGTRDMIGLLEKAGIEYRLYK